MRREQELRLIERVKSGDRAAFKELYSRYIKLIFNYLSKMLGSRDLAEEVTQMTMIKAFYNIHQYKPIGEFSSWLFTIAKNTARSELKKIKRRRSVSMETPVSEDRNITIGDMLGNKEIDIEEMIKKEDIRHQVERILAALPVRYREVVTLCWMQGLTYEEAAAILGCTRDAVSNRLKRAKDFINKVIDKISGDKR